MVFEIMALVKATQLAITGPGLALRGPEGSLKRAVDGMRVFQNDIVIMFSMAVVCFHIMAGMWAWLVMTQYLSIVVSNGVLLVFLFLMLRYSASVYLTFRFRRADLVTGQFTTENIRNLERSSLVVDPDEMRRGAEHTFVGDARSYGGAGGEGDAKPPSRSPMVEQRQDAHEDDTGVARIFSFFGEARETRAI